MAVAVLIPTVLRKHTAGKDQVAASGSNIREVLRDLEGQYSGFTQNLYAADGDLKPFINIYVNEEDIRFLQDLDTPVQSNDTVTILPAIAGG
jgi:molybdopterin synthase sulfur carrier subunit